MLIATAWSALLMGLLGGAHCLAMCAAPCGAVAGAGRLATAPDGVPVRWSSRRSGGWRLAAFHLGRLAGYSAAGGAAAFAVDQLAWLTQNTAALRPVWTLMHLAVLAWGLLMVAQSRQPAWVERTGRTLWGRVQPVVSAPGGAWLAGFGWALMPCGLLYSALLVSSLSGSVAAGAFAMLLFGLGSGLWLVGGGWAWSRLRTRLDSKRTAWGTRLAGALLCALAGWALWMDAAGHAPL